MAHREFIFVEDDIFTPTQFVDSVVPGVGFLVHMSVARDANTILRPACPPYPLSFGIGLGQEDSWC